jgi:hypothetical protein
MPSTPGMRTSISTTSGVRAQRRLDRLAAVGGLADDLDVALEREHRLDPAPHERLIVGDEDLDRLHARPDPTDPRLILSV